jgi:hypothetical protein
MDDMKPLGRYNCVCPKCNQRYSNIFVPGEARQVRKRGRFIGYLVECRSCMLADATPGWKESFDRVPNHEGPYQEQAPPPSADH